MACFKSPSLKALSTEDLAILRDAIDGELQGRKDEELATKLSCEINATIKQLVYRDFVVVIETDTEAVEIAKDNVAKMTVSPYKFRT